MTREEAINAITAFVENYAYGNDLVGLKVAIEELHKPSRIWIAKNEYRRGWHDSITKALAETQKICIANETFEMVQKETLIGLGLSMDSALGAEPYSETEGSYPEPDRPHGEWIKGKEISRTMLKNDTLCIDYKDFTCSNCGLVLDRLLYHVDGSPFYNFCPNCGARMKEGDEK